MFAVAELLSQSFDVTVGGLEIPAASVLSARGFPTGISMTQMTDRDFAAASSGYDLVVAVTNEIPAPSRAKASLLIVQFPFTRFRPSHPVRAVERSRILSSYSAIVYSDFVREWTERRWHVPSTVVSPPIEGGSFDRAAKGSTILSVGRFFTSGHSKRQDVLIDAFLALPPRVRESWTLVLAGAASNDHKSSRYLASLRERAGDARIEFAVNVPQAELQQHFSTASLFWHAAGYGRSAKQPGRAEHFGMATVEAMSWGAVPLVFDDGGQREIVTNDVGCRWRTIEELTAQTIAVIADDHRREQLAIASNAASEKYSTTVFSASFGSCVDGVMHR